MLNSYRLTLKLHGVNLDFNFIYVIFHRMNEINLEFFDFMYSHNFYIQLN